MSACRRMFALALLCLGTFSEGQLPAQATVAGVLGPHWREMSRAAGTVFSGTVLSIEAQPAGKGQPLPTILTKFRVDRAITGVEAGQILTLREWAGAWDTHRPMSAGNRLLILLYPPSRLGFTSPVGGRLGIVPLDARGEIFDGSLLPQFPAPAPVPQFKVRAPRIPPDEFAAVQARITLAQLERAIRNARRR